VRFGAAEGRNLYDERRAEDRRAILESGFFDPDWYFRTYPDAAASGSGALTHYQETGWREGRAPGPGFDSAWYLSQNPDVAAAGEEPLLHYMRFGATEGRKPRDERSEDDRPAVLASGLDALTQHQEPIGREERSPGRGFDSAWYLSQNPDVAAAGEEPLLHYVRFGAAEGRKPYDERRAEDRRAILESGFFDPDWYFQTYPDAAASGLDALTHYQETGWREGRSPGPGFDSAWYLSQNPDVAAVGEEPLLHYRRFGAAEGRKPQSSEAERRALVTSRRTLESIGDLDYGLYASDAYADLRRIPMVDAIARCAVSRAIKLLLDRLERPYDHLIFVPWLVHGGADLVAVNAARACVEFNGARSTLVVVSDYDRLEAKDWLPGDVDIIVFSDLNPDLSRPDRIALAELLICAMQPKTVLNVNSFACWEAFRLRGVALSTFTRLFAGLFCRDYTADGRPAGYADTHFRDCLPSLERVYFDNATFIEEMVRATSVPESLREKLVVLRQPISFTASSRSSAPVGAPGALKVIWSGRICRQKNIDLLMRIAQQAPDIQFDVWGEGEFAEIERLRAFAKAHGNTVLRGPFSNFEALPIADYGAYLYTSLWDGLPNSLISAASSNIPIVTSKVGGIGELVDARTGWLIDDTRDASPYVDALTEIHQNPGEALRRANALQEKVRDLHSWDAHMRTLIAMPSFLGNT